MSSYDWIHDREKEERETEERETEKQRRAKMYEMVEDISASIKEKRFIKLGMGSDSSMPIPPQNIFPFLLLFLSFLSPFLHISIFFQEYQTCDIPRLVSEKSYELLW